MRSGRVDTAQAVAAGAAASDAAGPAGAVVVIVAAAAVRGAAGASVRAGSDCRASRAAARVAASIGGTGGGSWIRPSLGSASGGTGALVNLILRLYDVTGGAILIDGADIRRVTQHDLRARIGFTPQKSALFSGTVDSNLRFADDDAAETAIRSAIEIAQASLDDIMSAATKLSEMSVKLLTESAEPISEQMGKTMRKASEAVAA